MLLIIGPILQGTSGKSILVIIDRHFCATAWIQDDPMEGGGRIIGNASEVKRARLNGFRLYDPTEGGSRISSGGKSRATQEAEGGVYVRYK